MRHLHAAGVCSIPLAVGVVAGLVTTALAQPDDTGRDESEVTVIVLEDGRGGVVESIDDIPAQWPGFEASPPRSDLKIGWQVHVGVGGAGREEDGHLARAVWDYDASDWRTELRPEDRAVIDRVGDSIDYVELNHPHGLGPWYVWTDDGRKSRMRFDAVQHNPHTADLDGLVGLFPAEWDVGFYFGSPRCSDLGWDGFDRNPWMCWRPDVFVGEAMSHAPVYVALDAAGRQTVGDGPWTDVRDYIQSNGAACLIEPQLPAGRDDMADLGLWTYFRGWAGEDGWRHADWPVPIGDVEGPVVMSYSHAPSGLGHQSSDAANEWRWEALFEAREVPGVSHVNVPWGMLAEAGYPIERLVRYLRGEDIGPYAEGGE